jgi:hypothetical protein
MNLDGEYRIGFIKSEAPKLDFGNRAAAVSKRTSTARAS